MHKIKTKGPFDHKTKTGFVTYPVGVHTVTDDVLKSAKKAKVIEKETGLPPSPEKALAAAEAENKTLKKEISGLKSGKEIKSLQEKLAAGEKSASKTQEEIEAALAAFNAMTGDEEKDVKSLSALTALLEERLLERKTRPDTTGEGAPETEAKDDKKTDS